MGDAPGLPPVLHRSATLPLVAHARRAPPPVVHPRPAAHPDIGDHRRARHPDPGHGHRRRLPRVPPRAGHAHRPRCPWRVLPVVAQHRHVHRGASQGQHPRDGVGSSRARAVGPDVRNPRRRRGDRRSDGGTVGRPVRCRARVPPGLAEPAPRRSPDRRRTRRRTDRRPTPRSRVRSVRRGVLRPRRLGRPERVRSPVGRLFGVPGVRAHRCPAVRAVALVPVSGEPPAPGRARAAAPAAGPVRRPAR